MTKKTLLKQGENDKLTHSSVVPEISSYLTTAEKHTFFSSNQTFYRKFQPNFILTSLLQYVVTGNQNKVIQLLVSSPQLMVIQGRVTDKSGRTFPKASAVELARWCGDRYIEKAMLNVLRSLANAQLAEKIKACWVALDEAYDLNGLEFVLSGDTELTQSFAFSLAPLLNALQVYTNTFNTMTWDERQTHWCTKVGAEQRLLTAYYLQQYCNKAVPFCPTPSFAASTFPRSLEIYNYNTNALQGVWDDIDSGGVLGRDIGIVRSSMDGGRGVGVVTGVSDWEWMEGAAWVDLIALRACEERTGLDLVTFKQKLREPLNQQPVAESKSSCCSIS